MAINAACRQRWEYITFISHESVHDGIPEGVQELGRDGWKLVSVQEGNYTTRFYLGRPILDVQRSDRWPFRSPEDDAKISNER